MGKLMNYDEIFTKEAGGSNEVAELPLNALVAYRSHKFSPTRADFEGLVESIRENGVIEPIIVHPIVNGKYEIIAGHRRVEASRKAGRNTIKAVILDIDDTTAWLMVSESNVYQSSMDDNKPSELADIIEDYYAALKANKKRSKLINSVNLAAHPDEVEGGNGIGKTSNAVGEYFHLSDKTIERYIRIAKLIRFLKDEVDAYNVPIRAGVELSYLPEKMQMIVANILQMYALKCTWEQAVRLRTAYEEGQLDESAAMNILKGEKKRTDSLGFKPMKDVYAKYFHNGETADDVQHIVDTALKEYFSKDR